MENKLKKLFDYQRFENNAKLEKLIRETETHYAAELSDVDLLLVNAAGEPEIDIISCGSTPQEKEQVGGIAGCNDNGTITDCYHAGSITGDFIGNYADVNDPKK